MANSNIRTDAIGQNLVGNGGALYVINLPERRDRRIAFECQLKRIGLDLAHPQVHLLRATRPAAAAGFPSIGACGCFLSHLEAVQRARDGGATHLVVCEDDMDFATDFETRAPVILHKMAAFDWDIIQAGHKGLPEQCSTGAQEPLVPIEPDIELLHSHFMLFHGRILGNLAQFLEALLERAPGDPDGGPMHVDGAYNHFRRRHPTLKAFATQPVLAVQRASRSDITPANWFDKVPVLRTIAETMRRAGSQSR